MSQNRMERFSPIAQRVLKNAEQEAREFQQDAIYPHHLFLSLLRESDGTAFRVLRSYHLNYERVRPLVNLIVSGSYRGAYNPIPELTPQIKAALEMAVDESRRLRHHYIGSEHLLLGLLNHLDDVMEETLERLKTPAALLRDRTHEILQSYSEAPDAPPQQVTVSVPELVGTMKPAHDERLRMLQLVAKGELSPEEALNRFLFKFPPMPRTGGSMVQQSDSQPTRRVRLTIADVVNNSPEVEIVLTSEQVQALQQILADGGQAGLEWQSEGFVVVVTVE